MSHDDMHLLSYALVESYLGKNKYNVANINEVKQHWLIRKRF